LKDALKGVAIVLGGIFLLALAFLRPRPPEEEPQKHRQAREQILFKSWSYGEAECEVYLVRTAKSAPPLDQFTCFYLVIYPSRGFEGDIDGILEVYNPEDTKWSEQETVTEMVCEYGRFGAKRQEVILADGRRFDMHDVTEEDIIHGGYIMWRVKVV